MEPKPIQLDSQRLFPRPKEDDSGLASEKPEVTAASPASVAPPGLPQDLEEQIIAALRTCYDPEIPVNIYEMGLVYGIHIDPAGAVEIKMTLTSPACPVAGSLPPEVQSKIQMIPGVTSARVEIVWDPPWNPDMMSEAARLELGMF